jgi:DNA-binding MarR family transcriptional regulator
MKDFYQSLGYLILGSRLRRLSEYYLSEINQVYAKKGIKFDASWFPVFYLLSQHQPINILELSETMQISHSAASQLITVLKKNELVKADKNKEDGRKQEITLTVKGSELLVTLTPVWESISNTMTQLIDTHLESKAFLNTLTSVEQQIQSKSLSERILTDKAKSDEQV